MGGSIIWHSCCAFHIGTDTKTTLTCAASVSGFSFYFIIKLNVILFIFYLTK